MYKFVRAMGGLISGRVFWGIDKIRKWHPSREQRGERLIPISRRLALRVLTMGGRFVVRFIILFWGWLRPSYSTASVPNKKEAGTRYYIKHESIDLVGPMLLYLREGPFC